MKSSSEVLDLSKIVKGRYDGWISVSTDYQRVIARGKTFKELTDRLEKLGNPKGYLIRTPKHFSSYVGG